MKTLSSWGSIIGVFLMTWLALVMLLAMSGCNAQTKQVKVVYNDPDSKYVKVSEDDYFLRGYEHKCVLLTNIEDEEHIDKKYLCKDKLGDLEVCMIQYRYWGYKNSGISTIAVPCNNTVVMKAFK